MSTKSLWIFGYGSLLWNPGFKFIKSKQGVIRGYSRKFWQGNTTHRGTPEQPGRVATLIEDNDGAVWGVAYEVSNNEAITYLDQRECHLGGYTTVITTFYPSSGEQPFTALLYMATPESCHWLGNASEMEIANQIVKSSGASGHNVEYLIRLAEYIRTNAPNINDEHLFNLEDLVRNIVMERSLSLDKLMGPTPPSVIQFSSTFGTNHDNEGNLHARQPTITNIQFTSTVPSKTLRCVSI